MSLPTSDEFLGKLAKLKVWSKHGRRAPHKSLLVLFALGRIANGKNNHVRFKQIEPAMNELLKRFGPDGAKDPYLPFVHLCRDGLWQIPKMESIKRDKLGRIRRSGLIHADAEGGLPKKYVRHLKNNQDVVEKAASRILNREFPASMHDDIRRAVGLQPTFPTVTTKRRKRDPDFRDDVLTAYERRCVVCDYDLRIDDELFGLDAAHIRWFAYDGPDDVTNGLALCTFHHRAFDRGAFSIQHVDYGYKVIVSMSVNGLSDSLGMLRNFHRKPVRPPLNTKCLPDAACVKWHFKQVFRGVPLD